MNAVNDPVPPSYDRWRLLLVVVGTLGAVASVAAPIAWMLR